uniref:Polyketide synthase n=1 Tax=Ganoderma boninense TaxID=34458 RepID=A0A5K1JYP8_9APHY
MAGYSRSRLLSLVRRDYRPNAWRRQADIEELLSQLSEECGRWIPYTNPAVSAVRDALQDGTILPAVVPQVIHNAYMHAFERDRPRVTRSIISAAINRQVGTLNQATGGRA